MACKLQIKPETIDQLCIKNKKIKIQNNLRMKYETDFIYIFIELSFICFVNCIQRRLRK